MKKSIQGQKKKTIITYACKSRENILRESQENKVRSVCRLLFSGNSSSRRQCRYPGIFLHHPNLAVVQTNAPLTRSQDSGTYVQSISERIGLARFLPRSGHCRLRQSRVLRRTTSNQS